MGEWGNKTVFPAKWSGHNHPIYCDPQMISKTFSFYFDRGRRSTIYNMYFMELSGLSTAFFSKVNKIYLPKMYFCNIIVHSISTNVSFVLCWLFTFSKECSQDSQLKLMKNLISFLFFGIPFVAYPISEGSILNNCFHHQLIQLFHYFS